MPRPRRAVAVHVPRVTIMCRAPLESPRRGGDFEHRHSYTRAIDMPSAMPDDMDLVRIDDWFSDVEVNLCRRGVYWTLYQLPVPGNPLWPYDLMALWPYGLMALWPYGLTALRSYGLMT